MSARVRELAALFDARRGSMLEDLESLVIRESPSNESSLVSELARWIATRLGESGVAASCVPCAGRGDALLVRIGPERGGTLLLGHLDTVWPAGTLREIPFRVEEGVARGPGVFDMKGGVTVAISVLEALARGDLKAGEGVTLFLTPDEEVGSGASRDLLVGEALSRDRVFVLEPSGDGGAAKIARKGTGLVTARFTGVAAHAGLEPEKGASALLEMSRFALYADALQDLPSGTSVVPTVAESGRMTNVVPEQATLSVDFRLWSEAEGERILAGLRAYRPADGRVAVTIEGGVNRPPMEPTEASLALYRRAAALAQTLGFSLPGVRVGGGSDGNLTASAGVPTLDGLGPSGAGAHARTEHLLVDDLPRRAALLAALLEDAA
ncbi:MAG: M20/M25/M40 family metallo-hydrolase [Thermoanaerobaculia bacterium]|nr:M20/M25/M40 family metallo-hydrolase [Thermoanaerobaculia bacterium]